MLDEGELTELLEVPREETEVRAREPPEDQGKNELHPEPALDIPMITKDPEVIAEREGVQREFKLRSNTKTREAEISEEVMLEIPPEWNAVPDLIMEDEEELMTTETDNKRKRDEVMRGRRKQRKEMKG